jgi:hypothetical protein
MIWGNDSGIDAGRIWGAPMGKTRFIQSGYQRHHWRTRRNPGLNPWARETPANNASDTLNRTTATVHHEQASTAPTGGPLMLTVRGISYWSAMHRRTTYGAI